MPHLHQFKGESFVEDPVDLSSTRQLHGADLRAGTFNALLKITAKRRDHSVNTQRKKITSL